jgi:hypothetical protein
MTMYPNSIKKVIAHLSANPMVKVKITSITTQGKVVASKRRPTVLEFVGLINGPMVGLRFKKKNGELRESRIGSNQEVEVGVEFFEIGFSTTYGQIVFTFEYVPQKVAKDSRSEN